MDDLPVRRAADPVGSTCEESSLDLRFRLSIMSPCGMCRDCNGAHACEANTLRCAWTRASASGTPPATGARRHAHVDVRERLVAQTMRCTATAAAPFASRSSSVHEAHLPHPCSARASRCRRRRRSRRPALASSRRQARARHRPRPAGEATCRPAAGTFAAPRTSTRPSRGASDDRAMTWPSARRAPRRAVVAPHVRDRHLLGARRCATCPATSRATSAFSTHGQRSIRARPHRCRAQQRRTDADTLRPATTCRRSRAAMPCTRTWSTSSSGDSTAR